LGAAGQGSWPPALRLYLPLPAFVGCWAKWGTGPSPCRPAPSCRARAVPRARVAAQTRPGPSGRACTGPLATGPCRRASGCMAFYKFGTFVSEFKGLIGSIQILRIWVLKTRYDQNRPDFGAVFKIYIPRFLKTHKLMRPYCRVFFLHKYPFALIKDHVMAV